MPRPSPPPTFSPTSLPTYSPAPKPPLLYWHQCLTFHPWQPLLFAPWERWWHSCPLSWSLPRGKGAERALSWMSILWGHRQGTVSNPISGLAQFGSISQGAITGMGYSVSQEPSLSSTLFGSLILPLVSPRFSFPQAISLYTWGGGYIYTHIHTYLERAITASKFRD